MHAFDPRQAGRQAGRQASRQAGRQISECKASLVYKIPRQPRATRRKLLSQKIKKQQEEKLDDEKFFNLNLNLL